MRRSIGSFLAFWALAQAGCADDYVKKPGPGDGGVEDGGGGGELLTAPLRVCTSEFTFDPQRSVTTVGLAGEWNGFAPEATPMAGPDAAGHWKATVELPEGAYAYKVVIDGSDWILDPGNPYQKYVGGVENSVREVDDCKRPRVRFVKLEKSASGVLHAEAQLEDGAAGAGIVRGDVSALLDGAAATGLKIAADGLVSVDADALAKTKHRLVVQVKDRGGQAAEPLQVPFWIEDQPFDFRDGMMYFAFTDRFRDGDPANDAPASDVDARANYAGGDWKGIQQSIADGYFDALGVRTLWLSPPNANPDHSEIGSGGYRYTGYHGYWPTAGRETQKRFGSLDDLKALVKAAHDKGMRVIIDSVLNHVHKENPLYAQHQGDGWFFGDGSCVCGGPSCDWTTHALDCWFQPYMPDLNYENFDALTTMVDDALFWAREADVDGFRVDAVKHFQRAATRRLRAKLRDQFEHAGPLFYLVGETFDGDRDLINSYIGPDLLHAQFDFPVYFALRDSLGTYSANLRALESATAASDQVFGSAPMSTFLGNHDVPRFLTTAAIMLWTDPLAQAWQMPPAEPTDEAGYFKLRNALTFVATQPGVPLIYYGDEYGMPGAADPDNRRMMKFSGHTGFEQATLDHAKRVFSARRELVALRRGSRSTLWIDDNLYVYARVAGNDVALVAINREWNPRTVDVPVPGTVPLADGTVLKDRLGGPSVTVAGGLIPLTLPAHQSAVLAP